MAKKVGAVKHVRARRSARTRGGLGGRSPPTLSKKLPLHGILKTKTSGGSAP
ncbi:MAG: hypothetical protein QOE90_765 [Thermoplasmata archaeon]|jgi:hypothetical protein|nr:hypothetical protein [Thermoplasmata archaeon]